MNTMSGEHLQNLFATEPWRNLFTTLSDNLGFSLSVYARTGEPIVAPAAPLSPCMSFRAASPPLEARCRSSCHPRIMNALATGKCDVFKCYAGIMSYALPIEYREDKAVILGQGSFSSYEPRRFILVDVDPGRLDEAEALAGKVGGMMQVETGLNADPGRNDALMLTLPAHSLVINATGLGRDRPGSPLSAAGIFPYQGIAWDFNYRGALVFLEQARAQQAAKQLQIEDGWIYFIHGWTRVIAEVFHIDIPTRGPRFEELADIAALAR